MTLSQFKVEQAKRLESIRPSGIRKMFQRAAGLEGVISLGIGAPDIMPPEKLLNEVNQLLSVPQAHGYTLNNGYPLLKEKIVEQYKEVYNLDYDANNVVVGTGGTEVLFSSIYAFTNPGDEVIVPDPGFVYYPTIPMMAGCKVVPIPLDENYQMPPELVNEAVSEKTKMIIMNTPSNPTGSVLTEKTIKGIADVAKDNNLIILSDEVYEFLTFDDKVHYPISRYAPENTVVLNSFSKTYCVTGWRLGYGVTHSNLIGPLSKFHAFVVANAPSLSQYAVANFMGTKEDKAFRLEMKKEMQHRRDVTLREFSKISALKMNKTTGSFYSFPEVVDDSFNGEDKGTNFTEEIFKEAKVVMVPGIEFGETRKGNIRISFGSANESKLIESANRIKEYLEKR